MTPVETDAPSIYDDAAWAGVHIQSGGLLAPDREAVRAFWIQSGMPVDVIDYFLDHPPRPDTIYEISGSGGVAFTARACDVAVMTPGDLADLLRGAVRLEEATR